MLRMLLESQLGQAMIEATYLLYQAYFKPFTLARELSQIHPDLGIDDNPCNPYFARTAQPRLAQYIQQFQWLATIVPLVAAPLVETGYSLAIDTFNWMVSGTFLLAWWTGLWLTRQHSNRLERWFAGLLGVCILAIVLWNLSYQVRFLSQPQLLLNPNYFSVSSLWLLWAIGLGLMFSIAFGRSMGLAISIALGVAGSISFGIGIGVGYGVVYGVTLGSSFGVAIALGSKVFVRAALSLVRGVLFGALLGIGLGISGALLQLSIPFIDLVEIGLAGGLAVEVAIGAAAQIGNRNPNRWTRGMMGDITSSSTRNLTIGLLFGIAMGAAFAKVHTAAVGVALTIAWSLGVLRMYVWVPELVWMGLLSFLTRSGKASEWLRYLPPYFDELILLPLPFMSSLIVRAYSENPVAVRQVIHYLTTSTNQQPIAARSLSTIAVEQLRQCQTLDDICVIAMQLDWAATVQATRLTPLLVQFLEISQGVTISRQASSAYRQKELLGRSLDELHRLQNSLTMETTVYFATTFGSIVERWLAILESAWQTLSEQAQRSREIPQVYIPGPALDPDRAKGRFKGRLDLFRQIESLTLAAQPPVLLLHGGRRTGKTSLLKYLPRRVSPELIPLLVNLHSAGMATTLSGFAQKMAVQVVEAARRSRNLHLPLPDFDQLQREPFLVLETWFEQLERCVDRKQLLLCFDEFERLSEIIELTQSHAPLHFLRYLLQERSQWILLFSGSHQLSELPTYWSDYLIESYALRVTYLRKAEARELIVQPIEDFPDIYEPDAIDAILHLTHCQPFLIQLMCYELVEGLNQTKQLRVTVQDVEAIVPTVLSRGDRYFSELWNRILTQQERYFLQQLVQPGTNAKINAAIGHKLTQKEILETRSGHYQFQVPLVQKFVEQIASALNSGSNASSE